MEIIQVDLNKDYSEAIKKAVDVLSAGGVIVYPTDTLYGLGANALNPEAVERVFKVKGRSLSKPMPIIVKNLIWAKELAYIGKKQEELLEKVWPGRFTAVLAKKDVVPDILTAGQKTVGLRIPDYTLTDKILGKFGYPLTSTSANVSGHEHTGDINIIVQTLSHSIFMPDLIIDVGILPKSDPSIVVDLTDRNPRILRVGPSKPSEFMRLLKL